MSAGKSKRCENFFQKISSLPSWYFLTNTFASNMSAFFLHAQHCVGEGSHVITQSLSEQLIHLDTWHFAKPQTVRGASVFVQYSNSS